MQALRTAARRIHKAGMLVRAGATIPVLKTLKSLSFSQYGEDVILAHFIPSNTGFYIDVGAYHPWQFSNTYKLYLSGWRGITIEPNPDTTAAFERMRPRDIHLNCGISERASDLVYYRFRDAKLNSRNYA